MVRPYAVKWMKKQTKKRRKTEDEEKHDLSSAPEPEEEVEEDVEERKDEKKEKKRKKVSATATSVEERKDEKKEKKRKKVSATATSVEVQEEENVKDESNEDSKLADVLAVQVLPGLPPSLAPFDEGKQPGVIFVLEKASLRIGKVGKKEQILSADEHGNFLMRQKLNPAEFRPDILHQALLSILDRPLTKAGRLQALYVKTDDGELFEVKPHVRLPRTFKRFLGLMYQLKSEKRIHASGKRENLFRMIKNPVTRHLPINARKIGFSHSSSKLVKIQTHLTNASNDVPLVFVVGAMAHGKIDADYVDEFISVSDYPLSAACCISRVCEAMEHKWNII